MARRVENLQRSRVQQLRRQRRERHVQRQGLKRLQQRLDLRTLIVTADVEYHVSAANELVEGIQTLRRVVGLEDRSRSDSVVADGQRQVRHSNRAEGAIAAGELGDEVTDSQVQVRRVDDRGCRWVNTGVTYSNSKWTTHY